MNFYLFTILLFVSISSYSSECIEKFNLIVNSSSQNQVQESKSLETLKERLSKRLKETDFQTSKSAQDFFSDKNLKISTMTPSSLREIILNDGADSFQFKTAFEDGVTSSAGASGAARIETEALRLGIPLKEFTSTLKKQERPYYGFLMFKNSPVIPTKEQLISLENYGEDIWVFKTENVVSRTTFTIGDSMDSYSSSLPLPKAISETSGKHHDYFLPLQEMRHVLVDHMVREVEKMGNEDSIENFARPFHSKNISDAHKKANYYEIQIFKDNNPLSLDDIEEYYFTKNTPSEELTELLLKKGIKVFDWRIQEGSPLPIKAFSEIDNSKYLISKTSSFIREHLIDKVYMKDSEVDLISDDIDTLVNSIVERSHTFNDGGLDTDIENFKNSFKVKEVPRGYNKFNLSKFINEQLPMFIRFRLN